MQKARVLFLISGTLIGVSCGEEAPQWSEIPPVELAVGGTATIDLDDYVQDADNPDEQLLIAVFGGSAETIQSTFDASTHELTLVGAADYEGQMIFEVMATDPDGQSGSTSFIAVAADATPVPGDIPRRSCITTFTYQSQGPSPSSVHVAGEFNQWDPDATALVDGDGDGIYQADLLLSPGHYQYKYVIDGETWILDEDNAYQAFDGGFLNSRITAEDCMQPQLQVVESQLLGPNAHITLQYILGSEQGALPTGDVARITVAGEAVDFTLDETTGLIEVPLAMNGGGKYSIHATPLDEDGQDGALLYHPLWAPEDEMDWRDAILYFAMTDRFYNGNAQNDGPIAGVGEIANYQGGDWQGLAQKIDEGYFDALGVNAIWISPIRDNVDDAEYGDDGRLYTGYHGYWPQNNGLESRFGGAEGLHTLVKSAHAHGIRIMLDLVANHVHDNHAWWQDNPEWFNDYDWCGDGNSWDLNPVGCWFTEYLPDIDYQAPDPLYAMEELTLELVKTYDLDAIRLDAVKHMDPVFERNMVARIEDEIESDALEIYLVGETFTGAWDDGGYAQGLIADHIGDGLLDGQFDFPLYWEVIKTFARDEQGFVALNDVVEASEGYYGDEALMSTFLGNHDIPRFISHAQGDIGDMWGNGAKEQGWVAPPAQPTAGVAYEKLRLAFTFLMTHPGVPLIYYGDEVGLAGAGDPDNRRAMPWDGLSAAQEETRAFVGQLAQIRQGNRALSRGDRQTLFVDHGAYIYARTLGDEVVLTALNRGIEGRTLTVPVAGLGLSSGTQLEDALGGPSITVVGNQVEITLDAHGGAIYVAP